MGFAAPARLILLAVVVAHGLALIWRARRDKAMLGRIGDERLVTDLIDPASGRWRLKAGMCAAALVLLILAAARPQFGTRLTSIQRRGSDIFIALDVSTSMLAEDIAPSRIEKARRSLSLLIKDLRGDRVGIIAFAGEAFLACPLTLDVDAARLFLETVSAGSAPLPGTALGRPVRHALGRYPKKSRARKILVLLTDGEDTRDSRPLEAAGEAKKAGVAIWTIGLGTPQGEVIRLRDKSGSVTGYKKDEKGETVLSRLDEATLIQMARLTGGKYFRSSLDDSEITSLAREISSFGGPVHAAKTHRVREERYQPLLLIAVLLMIAELLVSRRQGHLREVMKELKALRLRPFTGRGRAGIHLLAAAAAALAAGPAQADYRAELKKGTKLYRKGDLEQARQAYFNAQSDSPESPEAPYNIGNTYYYEGNFKEALRFFSQARDLSRHAAGRGNGRGSRRVRAAIEYNSGCALYRAGREEEAIDAFKEALRINPDDEDAKYNIEWIKSPKRPKQKKPGPGEDSQDAKSRLSKEDAERVLEMIRDQERNMLRDQRTKDENEKKGAGGKDW